MIQLNLYVHISNDQQLFFSFEIFFSFLKNKSDTNQFVSTMQKLVTAM